MASWFQFDIDMSGTIEFPEFCLMMADSMRLDDDEEMVRLTGGLLLPVSCFLNSPTTSSCPGKNCLPRPGQER